MVELLVVAFLVLLERFFAMSDGADDLAQAAPEAAGRGSAPSRGAKVAWRWRAPRQLLSTVQVGITLITVLTGVLGGDALGGVIAEKLRSRCCRSPAITPPRSGSA